ncbi:UNVERIFIED_CONTAM: hypothetical protein NCL1_42667 [Trichonephila clavipes]
MQNTLLMPSLRDGNAIETLLMTAQINTDFVNYPVPSTKEPSTTLVRVGTDNPKHDTGAGSEGRCIKKQFSILTTVSPNSNTNIVMMQTEVRFVN